MNSFNNINSGQPVILTTVNEKIYAGSYESKVLQVNKDDFSVTIPYSNGKLIPLSAGTKVEVTVNEQTFESEIISRKFGTDQTLTLSAPHKTFKYNKENSVSHTKVIAITSGKGGVGKSSLAINLALALSNLNQRVCLVDADLGMANIDVLLKMTPKYNLTHILKEEADIFDVIIEGPNNIMVIPGGSGWQDISNLTTYQFQNLVKNFRELESYTDIIIFDTGAGISNNVINFLLASDEILLITTPEPHAITDAYAMTKIIMEKSPDSPVKLIVNKSDNQKEGEDVGNKIKFAARQFLGISLDYLGCVRKNNLFTESARNQTPIYANRPSSPPAREIKQLATNIIGRQNTSNQGISGFFNKLAGLFGR